MKIVRDGMDEKRYPADVRAEFLQVWREAIGGALDENARKLLAEILDYPGVPRSWRTLDASVALLPVLPVSFRHGELRLDFFSAVTVLGTPQEVTLQELRIESFFPVDAATAAAAQRLADEASE